MGLFSGPWLTKEEHERSIHLNLISRINTLELNSSELRARLQVAQGMIAELEAALNEWQKWWELPWQDRRPDMADLCHMKARKVLGEKE